MLMRLTGKAVLAVGLCVAGYTADAAVAGESRATAMAGMASWYGDRFHGRRTANGERFDMNDLTAAHPTLPFGSTVRVVNRANNAAVEVRINDRGPYAGNRVIDLSRAAAKKVRMIGTGVAPVQIEVLRRGDG